MTKPDMPAVENILRAKQILAQADLRHAIDTDPVGYACSREWPLSESRMMVDMLLRKPKNAA